MNSHFNKYMKITELNKKKSNENKQQLKMANISN